MTALLATLLAALAAVPGATALGVEDTGAFDQTRDLARDLALDDALGATGWSIVDTALDAAADSSCTASTRNDRPGGYIAITGRGTFYGVSADWYNGCGGDTCDDYITGRFTGGGGAERHFGLFERELIDYGLCVVDCYFDTSAGPVWTYDTRGDSDVYRHPSTNELIIRFWCGQNGYGSGWQFGGFVYY